MITLNGQWKMKQVKEKEWHQGTVPGTVYTDLLTQGLIVDPYVGENEDEVRDLSYNDYLYEREFLISKEVLIMREIFLSARELIRLQIFWLMESR